MARKRLDQGLVVCLAAALLVLSLGSGTVAAKDVITLNLAHSMPESVSNSKTLVSVAKEVELRTNGRVKISVFPAGTLASSQEMDDAIRTGLVDIGVVFTQVVAGSYPITSELFTLPSIPWPEKKDLAAKLKADHAVVEIWAKMISEFPEIATELNAGKILQPAWWVTGSPLLTNKEVRVPKDIAGMKIAGFGIQSGELKAARAVPVPVIPPDYYNSAQTGLIKGILLPSQMLVLVFKLWEVFDYYVPTYAGCAGGFIMMNWDKWNSLPRDLQDIVIQTFQESNVKWFENSFNDNSFVLKLWLKAGKAITELTPEEKALWQEGLDVLEAEWIAKKEAVGIKSAGAMVARLKELVAQIE